MSETAKVETDAERQTRREAERAETLAQREAALEEARRIVAGLAVELARKLELPVRSEERRLIVGTVVVACTANVEQADHRNAAGVYPYVPVVITESPTSWKSTRWMPNDKGEFPRGRVLKRLKDKFHEGLLHQTKTAERRLKLKAGEELFRGLKEQFPLADEFFYLSDHNGDVTLIEIDAVPPKWLPKLMQSFHELRQAFPAPTPKEKP
jgi:hypothetical protein